MSGVPVRIKEQVAERDGWICQVCGTYVGPFGSFSIHHRRPRGLGGSRDPETNLPANLLFLCGSGTTGCHGLVESRREDAYKTGLLVRQGARPSSVPVETYRGRLLLDNDGSFEEVAA